MNNEINEEKNETAEEQEKAEGQPTLEEQQPQADADAEKRDQLKKTAKKEIREWIVALITALVVVVLVRMFLFTVIRVDGNSMYPTLINDERLFVTVADVKLGYVERGDVVICHYPNRGNTYFVKRVVGVPGDTVCRYGGVTYVNGEPLDPLGLASEALYDYDEYTLGEDEYFCVGDNRYDSHDSRDWNDGDSSRDVGPLDGSMLVGKVRYVIWPFSEIRAVE
ncbi:MAG: signal peptidase I [Clostridia bacterium]|nr:signal peptidase I [Clostridia bacterium]